ncbi:hypothetical protein K1719_020491 [Acacia pycnantha]|nr:hypothetical protein K1719_020491 [Acacia pycnantha]
MNREYAKETNRDVVMIAAAKLIANDVVPKEYLASEIVSHFECIGQCGNRATRNHIQFVGETFNLTRGQGKQPEA